MPGRDITAVGEDISHTKNKINANRKKAELDTVHDRIDRSIGECLANRSRAEASTLTSVRESSRCSGSLSETVSGSEIRTDFSEPDSLKPSFELSKLYHPIAVALLVVICWCLYAPVVVGAYFVADDIWQVHFAHKVFNGTIDAIWANMRSNYLQLPGFDFYRPLLTFTFLNDYFLSRTNPAGYHFTNLVFYCLNVIFLYTLVRQLTVHWSKNRSICTALMSATMFAVNPLHCEDVSWISGRADIVGGSFYLLSLNLFLRSRTSRRPLLLLLSIISFWFALGSKEISLGAPIVVMSLAFFLPLEQDFHKVKQSSSKLIVSTLWSTLPFCFSAFLYMLLRRKVLGTFIGGYTGVLGAALDQAKLIRWFEWPTYYHIAFPYTAASFSHCSWLTVLTSLCYITLALIYLLRLLTGRLSNKWVIILFIWALTTVIPLYKLWGVGPNLEGSRLVFYLTMPLSMLAPLLLLQPGRCIADIYSQHETLSAEPCLVARCRLCQKLEQVLIGITCAIFIVISALFFVGTEEVNGVWVKAGAEGKELLRQCELIAPEINAGEKVALLGTPLNGWTFEQLLSPPFTTQPLASKFLTFSPFIVGPGEALNTTRFRATMAGSNVREPLVWDSAKQTFVKAGIGKERALPMGLPEIKLSDTAVAPSEIKEFKAVGTCALDILRAQKHTSSARNDKYPATTNGSRAPGKADTPRLDRVVLCRAFGDCSRSIKSGSLVLSHLSENDGVLLAGLNLSPYDADILEFDLSCSLANRGEAIHTEFRGSSELVQDNNAIALLFCPREPYRLHHVRVRLSHSWRWFTCERIADIAIRFFKCQSLEISNIRLLRQEQLTPSIELSNSIASTNGEHFVDGEELQLQLDKRGLDACHMEIEITKPNYFFDNFLVGDTEGAVEKYVHLPAVSRSVKLPGNLFPKSAYYEIRCRCLRSDFTTIGEPSDPVTIFRCAQGPDALDSCARSLVRSHVIN